MSTFTIDNENNITVYAGTEEAVQAGDSTTTSFDSLAALRKVSADWQMSRFVEIWNSIPGQTPVKKFTVSCSPPSDHSHAIPQNVIDKLEADT